MHRDSAVLTVTAGNSQQPHQRVEERKDVICTTTRTLQGVAFPANHSLRKISGAPTEKPQAQGHKGLKP
jgi:hypothetical protein